LRQQQTSIKNLKKAIDANKKYQNLEPVDEHKRVQISQPSVSIPEPNTPIKNQSGLPTLLLAYSRLSRNNAIPKRDKRYNQGQEYEQEHIRDSFYTSNTKMPSSHFNLSSKFSEQGSELSFTGLPIDLKSQNSEDLESELSMNNWVTESLSSTTQNYASNIPNKRNIENIPSNSSNKYNTQNQSEEDTLSETGRYYPTRIDQKKLNRLLRARNYSN